MSRWKSLPESLDERLRRLVVEMRQLKDRSGLSLSSLGARTAYSRSSWERYLNGKAVPPRDAVEAFARVTGAAPEPLLALWDVAADAQAPEAAQAAEPLEPTGLTGPTGPLGTAEPAGRRGRGRPLLLALAVVGIAAAVALLVAAPWSDEDPVAARETATASPSAPGSASPVVFDCPYHVRDGLRYAGHSTTMDKEYGVGSGGEFVAEVQCLVQFHGFDPGTIDGVFGPLTEAAVQEFQRSRGLTDDGIVGPMTWAALRAVDAVEEGGEGGEGGAADG